MLAKRDPEAAGPALCVVKRLKLGADADTAVAAQFVAEARLAMRLHHPAIVEGFEAGEDADGPFLVLEYLEGQTLARVRSRAHRRRAGIPRAVAIHIALAIADGLAYAHELKDDKGTPLGIVHRDLSPDNVVVTYAGATKLIDFRMATRSDAVTPRVSVAYTAPEQLTGSVAVDGRADLFALGVILWELLAGRRMWEGLTEAAVQARLAGAAPLPTLRSVVADMPPALDALCAKALATVRDDRFDSAAELRDALEAAVRDTKLEASAAQVAELVTSLFEDEREKMRDAVDEALMRPAGGAAPIPQLRPLPPSSSNKFVDVDTDPRLWAPTAPKPAAPAVQLQVIEVAKPEPPRSDRRFTLLLVAAVVAVLGAVAIFALTAKSDPPPAPPPVALPRAPTSPAPEPSAAPEPEEIVVDIIVRPTTAKLVVDGVKTTNPYHTKIVRGKFPHEIKAEAEGFEPHLTTGVLFDRDRSIDIALVPKKPVFLGPGVHPDASPPRDAQ
ncbi:MAG: serine/threonine protein kinase [Labilithrix sp.]|nr:serine/threonine protein kinase [Labilithrix sp.]